MLTTQPFARRVAVVTGGSRGIGRAISVRLAKDGFVVVLVYRSATEAANEAAGEIRDGSGECLLLQSDVTDQTQVNAVFKEVRHRFGRLDVLVNNAGRAQEAIFALTPPKRFLEAMNDNFMSAVMCSQAAIRLMAAHKRGAIVNISSSSALRSPVGLGAYAASKAALNSLTRTMARELASSGIRVNAVAPSWTSTTMISGHPEAVARASRSTMLGRVAEPSEIAAIVAALVRDDMTAVTGQIMQFEPGS